MSPQTTFEPVPYLTVSSADEKRCRVFCAGFFGIEDARIERCEDQGPDPRNDAAHIFHVYVRSVATVRRLDNLALGSVGFLVDGRHVIMTNKQWALLRAIGTGKGRYVRGADVAVARKLVDGALATLEDYGSLKQNRRVDGERWFVEVSALGRVILGFDAGSES